MLKGSGHDRGRQRGGAIVALRRMARRFVGGVDARVALWSGKSCGRAGLTSAPPRPTAGRGFGGACVTDSALTRQPDDPRPPAGRPGGGGKGREAGAGPAVAGGQRYRDPGYLSRGPFGGFIAVGLRKATGAAAGRGFSQSRAMNMRCQAAETRPLTIP
jgi:hypothetical protein